MVSMVDAQRVGFALGAAAYLTKPIDRARLVKTLGEFARRDEDSRVLLVDDDAATREHVAKMLEDNGWQVLEAGNGQEALQALESGPRPSAILLDLLMPKMDGFEFIQALDGDPRFRAIPVVVITAMDLDSNHRKRLEGRVERILKKGSYTREELVDLVRIRVNHHARRDVEAMLQS